MTAHNMTSSTFPSLPVYSCEERKTSTGGRRFFFQDGVKHEFAHFEVSAATNYKPIITLISNKLISFSDNNPDITVRGFSSLILEAFQARRCLTLRDLIIVSDVGIDNPKLKKDMEDAAKLSKQRPDKTRSYFPY